MTPLSFKAWRAQELATRSPDLMVDCQECSGGQVECCECGQERDCENCAGMGIKRFGDLTLGEQNKVLDVLEYERQLIADYKAVAQFTVTQPEALLLEAGLQPYVRVGFLPRLDGIRIIRGDMGIGALERLRC